MITENENSTTETPSSQGGVISRSSWSLEEKRYLWDSLNANPYEYGRYVLAAEMQNKKFGTNRSAASCRSMDRRMLIRP